MEICFSLGSNLGERTTLLNKAIEQLCANTGTYQIAISARHETDPVEGLPEEAHLLYLNQILICETEISAKQWLDIIHALEAKAGRLRTDFQNAARPLDIDIIYCDQQTSDTPTLTLPHPRAHLREFVLAPLAELRPDLVLPHQSSSISELLAMLNSKSS